MASLSSSTQPKFVLDATGFNNSFYLDLDTRFFCFHFSMRKYTDSSLSLLLTTGHSVVVLLLPFSPLIIFSPPFKFIGLLFWNASKSPVMLHRQREYQNLYIYLLVSGPCGVFRCAGFCNLLFFRGRCRCSCWLGKPDPGKVDIARVKDHSSGSTM